MLTELLVSGFLWVTVDMLDPEVELRVDCHRVELDINQPAKASPAIVKFYFQSRDRKYIWSYRIPMDRTATGSILLDPPEYWVEEIKRLNSITFEIEGKKYSFALNGSYEALKECNGDVAE